MGERGLRTLHLVACVALLLIGLLTLSDILMRSVGRPITGSLELVTLLGALVFGFSLPYTSLKKGHVYVDLLVDRIGGGKKKALLSVTRLMGVVLFVFVGANFIGHGLDNIKIGEVTPSFRIPLYPLHFALAFCFFVEALVLFWEMISVVRGKA